MAFRSFSLSWHGDRGEADKERLRAWQHVLEMEKYFNSFELRTKSVEKNDRDVFESVQLLLAPTSFRIVNPANGPLTAHHPAGCPPFIHVHAPSLTRPDHALLLS